MASRRMFSQTVVGSDSFLDMPVSARELYFHLGMYADDDGFVSPKMVVRIVGASDDNLKILVGKGFLIMFDSGIACISHWKQNNYLRKDRYTPTRHHFERDLLVEGQKSLVYRLRSEVVDSGIPMVDGRYTSGIPSGSIGREVGRKEETPEKKETDEELVRVEETEEEKKHQKLRNEINSLFKPNKD